MRRARAVAVALVALLVLLALAAWLALPAWIETRLVPDLARRFGMESVALDLRRIGVKGLDVADIGIGTAITADHLTADYRLGDLVRRRIARIVISGLTVHAAINDGRLGIEGIPLPVFDDTKADPGASLPDAGIGRLEIHGGVLHLTWEKKPIKIPFSLVAVCPETDPSRINARLVLFPHHHPVRVMLQADAPENTLTAVLQTDDLPLDRPEILLPPGKWPLDGRLSTKAQVQAALFPFKIHSLQGQVAADLHLDHPATRLTATGIEGTFSARLETPSRWQAAMAAATTAPTLVKAAGGQTIQVEQPKIRIDLAGDETVLTLAARLTSGPGQTAPAGVKVTWPEINAEAQGTMDWRAPAGSAELRFDLRLPRMKVLRDQWQAQLGPIRLQGLCQPGGKPILDANLRAGGRISGPVVAEDIALYLPLQWPASDAPAGSLGLKLIPPTGFNSGRLKTVIRQTGLGLALNGTLHDFFFDGTALKIAAKTDWTETGLQGRLEAALPPWSPAAPVDLGRLAPAAAGITVDGNLTLDADLAITAGRLESRSRIRISGGTLAAPARKIHVGGIETEVSFLDLPILRSAPGQRLCFHQATLGPIRLSDGSAAFQIEGPRQVLLEKGSFQWCSGRVYAEALRFSPAVDDYGLTLYGDRLNLAELLDQIGGLTAEGGGTVSGRIPVHYRRGQVIFNDGFLYSSPGEGGKIRMADIERFTSAVDPQTLEAAQLALASEALKDYDYQWVKVGIDSQGEQLALRLQFDGKPAHPLPFVYRQELGRFVRVEAPDPGSRFQGIGLDIKLRLPLNRILEYGDLMKRPG
jgi:hypothetical protein